MDKPSWDKLKWRLIKNHLSLSKTPCAHVGAYELRPLA
jgi:hypothetical protein